MVKRKKNSPLLKKHYLVIAGIVAIAVAIGAWISLHGDDKDKTATTSSGTYVNLNPPTKEEKQATENHKKDLSDQYSSSSAQITTSSGKIQVTPVITNASQTEVRALVQGVAEDGGTCTALLTKGSGTISRTSTGISNVSYTTCPPIDISGSLSAGTWSLKVTYSSPKAEGNSETKSIEAQ